jgi:hypothetical protein
MLPLACMPTIHWDDRGETETNVDDSCPILDSPVPEWTKQDRVPRAVGSILSRIWAVLCMEGELQ